jgi:alpha-glucosidase
VYIRAGAIIPHRELEQYVGQMPVNPLTFDVYPGPASSHQAYLDDHLSTNAQKNGAFRLTQVTHAQVSGPNPACTVRVRRVVDNFTPPEPYYFVALLKTTAPASVTIDGTAIPLLSGASDTAAAQALTASAVNAAYYNTSLATTFVKVFDTKADTTIAASF